MSDTYTPPVPNAALVVGPDDHLVISLPADCTYEEFDAFQAFLYTRIPRDRVTVISGAEIAVIRNPADNPDAVSATPPGDEGKTEC